MSKAELDQLLNGVVQLETSDLERFVEQVNFILAQRKSPNLREPEVELIQQINQSLPENIQRRYDELRAKSRTETITSEEHEELLRLIDIVEQADVKRLQHLIELSQLRQVSLPDLMNQLGIHPPTVYA